MTRPVAASLAIALSVVGFVPQSVFAASETYRIQTSQDLYQVPCSAFKKMPDGSWNPTAIIFVGGKPRKGAFAKDSAEAQGLAFRCYNNK